MICDLDDQKLICEIRELVDGIDSAKEEVNVYCSLLKQIFLSGSTKN